MDEHKTPILELPERSAPKDDLDDLIFRGVYERELRTACSNLMNIKSS